jgi:putative transposase
MVQHVLNRGNKKETIFWKPADYQHFIGLIADALATVPMRILAFCLMPNHWHFVLWPEQGVDLSAFMDRLCNLHVRHFHAHRGTTGQGHIYQGRFHNFVVEDGMYLYRVIRYVEANALSAGLVKRAEDWPWSSLATREAVDGRQLLCDWPTPRPTDWLDYVNRGIPADELAELRRSVQRGAPFGELRWVLATAEQYGLKSTLNPPHRAGKYETAIFD